jgi:hypothetical protein
MSRAVQDSTDGTDSPEGTELTDEAADEVSADEAFELLSNRRRRYALHHLKYTEGSRTDLGTLSEWVASWENDTTMKEVNATERKRVYTSLQSHHLPKLDERGIVEYDDRAGTVELTESAEDLDLYLEIIDGRDVPWSQYYLGLSALTAGIVAAAAIDVWPFGLLPDIAWAAFVVTTIAVSAAVHVYVNSKYRLGTTEKPPELRDQ